VVGLDVLRADPFFVAQKAALLDAMDVWGGERVVDVGSGTGDDTAELRDAGCLAVGVEQSSTMLKAARGRYPDLPFVAADAGRLPFADAAFDRVRVDRVLQHLRDASGAVSEWRRVLRAGGGLVVFEPDLTTARIDGLDARAVDAVLRWRAGTRPGAAAVRSLADLLPSCGFRAVRVETALLDVDDLERADGIMGLAGWGEAAGRAGALDEGTAARWREEVDSAAADVRLRYRCEYVRGLARV